MKRTSLQYIFQIYLTMKLFPPYSLLLFDGYCWWCFLGSRELCSCFPFPSHQAVPPQSASWGICGGAVLFSLLTSFCWSILICVICIVKVLTAFYTLMIAWEAFLCLRWLLYQTQGVKVLFRRTRLKEFKEKKNNNHHKRQVHWANKGADVLEGFRNTDMDLGWVWGWGCQNCPELHNE